jgi:pimeloyl-ACP methyl ester carboxylesterase
MTMIDVDGGTVWAEDTGGDGPPLALIHPGVGDSRIWDRVLPALAQKYRVIRYDARGFGQSPAPTVKFSLLRDLVAVLGHYDIERTAIVGCSQGGATALGLALEQPDRVPALVLLCPGIPGFPLAEPDDPDGLGPTGTGPRPPATSRPWPASRSGSGAGPARPRRRWSSSARRPAPCCAAAISNSRIRPSTTASASSRSRCPCSSTTPTTRR